MNTEPRKAAVVGAGISGLVTASKLAKLGFEAHVFESGRGLGGRMSTRRGEAPDGTKVQFDMGAQFFTSSTKEFNAIVEEWERAGTAAPWEGRFACIDASQCVTKGVVTVQPLPEERRWVGTPTMNAVCKYLAATPGVTVNQATLVVGFSNFRGGECEEGAWKWCVETRQSGDPMAPVVTRGDYDVVVVTDKALASERNLKLHGEPSPMASAEVPEIANTMQRCSQRSCFTLMVVMNEAIATEYDSFDVCNHPMIAYMARNSSKPGRPSGRDQWLVHSTTAYADNFIYGHLTKKGTGAYAEQMKIISEEMFNAFSDLIVAQLQEQGGLPQDSEDDDSSPQTLPRPLMMEAHRWGAAFPMCAVAADEKCLSNTKVGFFACGDYCIPPSCFPYGYVEAATLSAVHTAIRAVEYTASIHSNHAQITLASR
mmetsp:Transcript_17134/g.33088  ORF Transcript_17134/g.33088 Transcript_17134/m.33088 type:complete len:427 (+) Transcript_17134:170-1450(+)